MKYSFIILTLVVSLQAATLHAQWSILSSDVRKSKGVISVIYFLDKQGKPNIGFAAGWGIYRTTDGGVRWTPVAGFSYGMIWSITFADSLNGWAAAGSTPALDIGAVYKTTDGGLTWSGVTTLPRKNYNGIHAISRTQIVASLMRDSGVISTDGGSSWRRVGIIGGTGFAFSDSDRGMVGRHNTYNHYTTDAGQTWNRVSGIPSAWQPLAIEGTGTFFISPWSGFSDSLIFLRSSDYGQTFTGVYDTAVTPYLKSAGQMGGYLSRLYFASPASNGDERKLGYYRSTDEGASWCNICGPSMNHYSRWYTKGDTIITWDSTYNIWINPTGTANIEGVSITPGVIDLKRKECGFFSTRVIIEGECKRDVTAEVLGITGFDQIQMRSFGGREAGYSALYTIIDIYFSEPPAGIDSGYLHLRLVNMNNTIDTLIPIRLEIEPQLEAMIIPSIINEKIMFCDDLQSQIQLLSGCGEYQIQQVIPADTGLIRINLSKPLPTLISTKDTFAITVLESGNRKDTILTYVTIVMVKDTIVRTVIIPINITRSGTPSISGTLKATLNTICRSLDTIIYIRNLACDSIQITSVDCSDSNFSISLTDLLPVTKPKNGTLAIRVTGAFKRPGTYQGIIHIKYVFRNKLYDTLFTIQASVFNIGSTKLSLSEALVRFDSTAPCLPLQRKVVLSSFGCDTIMIKGVEISGDVIGFKINSPTIFPFLLIPNTNDSLSISFTPSDHTEYNATVTIHYIQGGVEYDTTVQLTGAGIEDGSARISPDVLTFSDQLTCTSVTQTTYIQSFSCDSVRLSLIKPFAYSEFSLMLPIQPVIFSGDSTAIEINFWPKAKGSYTDDIAVEALTKSGRRDTLTLHVTGTAVNDTLRLQYERSLYVGEVSICSYTDSVVVIQNRSLCDTLTLTSLILSGDNDFVVDPMQLPLVIPPVQQANVIVNMRPQTVGGRTAKLIFTIDNSTYSRTDSIYLSTDILAGGKRLACNVVTLDFGEHPVCDLPSTAITLSNIGCDTITVDAADITGSGFTVDPSLFPLPIPPDSSAMVTVSSIIDTLGGKTSSSATLTFRTADAGSPVVTLTRAWIMPRTYAIVLDTVADATAGEFITMKLRVVGDIIGLQQVDLQLFFNTDMLKLTESSSLNSVFPLPANRFSIFNAPLLWIGSDGTIAEFRFRVHLTKDSVSDIIADEIVLNPRDSLYEACVARATMGTSNFNYRYVCGDRTLAKFLLTKTLTLDNIVPNPTEGNVTVSFTTYEAGELQIELFDALGRQVEKRRVAVSSGASAKQIMLNSSQSGIYTIRLTTGGSSVTGRFVKQ